MTSDDLDEQAAREHKRESARIAIAGVGNCASSLLQALTAAKAALLGPAGQGVLDLPGIEVSDLEVVAAFDVDLGKVGKPLSEAIFAEPNCTSRRVDVPKGVTRVAAGPVADGVDGPLGRVIRVSEECNGVTSEHVARELERNQAEVLVCLLPTGSIQAVEMYANAALLAECAFVNCVPEEIVRSEQWAHRFRTAGLPLFGDDIRSQLGATRLHQALLELCEQVGAELDGTYQLNVGGNTDFLNMASPSRAASKRETKKHSLLATVEDPDSVIAGPSGFLPYLNDRKAAHIFLEGRLLLDMKFTIDCRLTVEDSPNLVGVLLDVLRCAVHARRTGAAGPVDEVNHWYFKAPSRHIVGDETQPAFGRFMKGYDGTV